MEVDIFARASYLEVRVSDRAGSNDARASLQKIMAAMEAADDRRVLISVRTSPALANLEEYGLSDALTRAAGIPGLKVALLADSPEVFASYQHIERLASQKNLAAKAFRSEAVAIGWLQEP